MAAWAVATGALAIPTGAPPKSSLPPPDPVPVHPKPPALGEELKVMFRWCEEGAVDQRPGGGCLCFEPLACGKTCRTYDEELQRIQRAQQNKKRRFVCKTAEKGACGTWRYIYCDLGKAGSRLTIYDEGGRLRSLKEVTDTPDYCGGKAFTRYAGSVPACAPLNRSKLLSGDPEAESPLAPAADYPFAKGQRP
jgi:hypothetical protein